MKEAFFDVPVGLSFCDKCGHDHSHSNSGHQGHHSGHSSGNLFGIGVLKFSKKDISANAKYAKKTPEMVLIRKYGKKSLVYSPLMGRAYMMDYEAFQSLKTEELSEAQKKDLAEKGLLVEGGHNFFQKTGRDMDLKDQRNIFIFLTTNCNLGCRYCYADGGAEITTADMETVTDFMDQMMAGKKEFTVNIHGGGEQTLELAKLKQIVAHAKKLVPNPKFSIQSNGVISKSTLKFLEDNNFYITFSVDGPPDIQDRQRPIASTKMGSSGAVEATLRSAAKPASIRATISEYSVSRQKEMVEYFKNFDIKHLQFEPIIEAGRSRKVREKEIYARAPDQSEFVRNFLQAKELAYEYGMTLACTYINLSYVQTQFCGLSNPNISLTTDGYLSSCHEITRSSTENSDEFIYGRYDRETGKIIIDEEKLSNLRKMGPFSIADCQSCMLRYCCAGGCAHKNYMQSGSMFIPSKETCDAKRMMATQYLEMEAQRNLISIKPYLQASDEGLKYVMNFNTFDLETTENDELPADNAFIRITRADIDFEALGQRLADISKRKGHETTIFLLSFDFIESDMNIATGQKIISLLEWLKENKIISKVTRPLPKCLFGSSYLEITGRFRIPQLPRNSLELFSVLQDGTVLFWNGKAGKHISEYEDRSSLYEEAVLKLETTSICTFCIYKLRGNCAGHVMQKIRDELPIEASIKATART